MSKFEKMTSKIVEKSPSRAKAKGRGLEKVDNLMMGEQALNFHQIKNRKLRLPGKNARKGQGVNQKMNMMTGSIFMPMMTVNWQVT